MTSSRSARVTARRGRVRVLSPEGRRKRPRGPAARPGADQGVVRLARTRDPGSGRRHRPCERADHRPDLPDTGGRRVTLFAGESGRLKWAERQPNEPAGSAIDAERDHLSAVVKRIEAAVSAAAADRGVRARAASLREPSRARGSRRAKPGERERQLLSSVRTNPGFLAVGHARAIGVEPQQAYVPLKRLVAKGAIVKRNGRYNMNP